MNARNFLRLTCGFIAISLCLLGCERRSPQVAPPEAPTVPVSRPVAREVTDFVDFTGRTQAVNSVNVVPRVTGYLVKMPFQEGSEVKQGDLLFEIDPRPYQAQYDQAVGQVNLYKAQLKLAQVTLARDEEVVRAAPGAVSKQQIDQDKAAVDEADAQVKEAEASLKVYKLNLDFCRVVSPIDGQVSRYYLTLGNLVNQDQTLLTTVVSLDPIYAYVDVDEPTVLRVRRAINKGKSNPTMLGRFPSSWDYRAKRAFRERESSTSSITRSIRPRAVFWREASFPIPCRRRRPPADCSCLACSCGSGCRSDNRTRPCWSSIAPSDRTRG